MSSARWYSVSVLQLHHHNDVALITAGRCETRRALSVRQDALLCAGSAETSRTIRIVLSTSSPRLLLSAVALRARVRHR